MVELNKKCFKCCIKRVTQSGLDTDEKLNFVLNSEK